MQVALNATVRVDAMAAADLILDCPGKSDGSVCCPQPSTLNPQPSTLNPQPSTLNPQPSTLNLKP